MRIICNNFKNLTSLSMIGCAHCGDESCKIISDKLVKLKMLEIEEWTRLSQSGVNILSKNIESLKFLSIFCHQVNNGCLFLQGSRVWT